MSSSNTPWSIDQLERELRARPQVKDFILKREHVSRAERYFVSEKGVAIDQDRSVASLVIEGRIFVHLKDKPGKQGEASQRFFPERPLAPQVDQVIRSALQTEDGEWTLPTSLPSEQERPQLETCDPLIAEDLPGALSSMTGEVKSAVASLQSEMKDVQFHSAELFLSVHDSELRLSNGLVHRGSQSRIYIESAFSAPGPDLSDEYLHARWAVHRDEIKIADLFKESAERARLTRKVQKPEPGRYWVIVDAEVLSTLFHGHLSHLSGGNRYYGLPHTTEGHELIPGARADSADLMTWTIDPRLAYGPATTTFSSAGILQKALPVVRENQVVATLVDQQFAHYLKQDPGTSRGNLVINGGSLSHAELVRSQPRVLEILQFSGLFADPHSGTFSSEIRLARLTDRESGRETTIKGGSLSGSITENFTRARLSKDQVRFSHFGPDGQGYYGPAYALLNDVSIAG